VEEVNLVREMFNTSGKPFTNYPDLPYICSNGSVLKLNDFMYCVSGVVDKSWTKKSNTYRLYLKDLNSGWQEVTSMTEKSREFGAAVYNGCLIVAGGYNEMSKLNTIELYEPSLNKWSSFEPLNERKNSLALIAAHEKLFAIGGSDSGLTGLSSVH